MHVFLKLTKSNWIFYVVVVDGFVVIVVRLLLLLFVCLFVVGMTFHRVKLNVDPVCIYGCCICAFRKVGSSITD